MCVVGKHHVLVHNHSYYQKVLSGVRWNKMHACIKISEKRCGKKQLIILFDMLLCALFLGAGYYDYMWFDFAKLPWRKRTTYVTRLRNKKIISALNRTSEITENKYQFYLAFGEFMQRDAILSSSDHETFLSFAQGKIDCILKPVNGACGDGIEVLTLHADAFSYANGKRDYMLEERLIQHPALAALNADSLNTYRIVTICIDGKVHLLYASIRIGRTGSCTDNTGRGGILCSIDTKQECISSSAYDDEMNEYIRHPDSHIFLKGYSLPYVQRAVEMCFQAAKKYETYGVRFVGWDVGVLPDSVTLIESNTYPSYDLWQKTGFEDGERPLGCYGIIKKIMREADMKL